MITFRVTVPHDLSTRHNFHEWFFPNGWRGIGPIERRDRRGYLQGDRRGIFSDWFVLACNNADCPGRAVVPVRFLTDHVDNNDPDVTR